jgi:hypothetical protein
VQTGNSNGVNVRLQKNKPQEKKSINNNCKILWVYFRERTRSNRKEDV